MIVRVWSDTCVNLKVLVDGNFDFWVTSASQGDGPRNWNWRVIPPVEVPLQARLAGAKKNKAMKPPTKKGRQKADFAALQMSQAAQQ